MAGFSGADPEYAGIYLHARYFDPKLGLFLSPDPLDPGEPRVGSNRYGYALGNPISFGDRTGFMVPCSGSPVSGGAGPWKAYWGEDPNKDPSKPHYEETITVTPTFSALSDCSYFDNGPLTPIEKFDLVGVVDLTRVLRTGGNTQCKQGDANCDKAECKPGDPGCNTQPPDTMSAPSPSGTVEVSFFAGLGGKIMVTNGEGGFGFCVQVGLGKGFGASYSPTNSRPQTGLRVSGKAALSSTPTGGFGLETYASRDILGTGELVTSSEFQWSRPLSGERVSRNLNTGEYRVSGSFGAEAQLHFAAGVCIGY